MNKDEFIAFWEHRLDTDGTRAVGIGVSWTEIRSQDCSVMQFYGDYAWKKIGYYWAPHWGNFTRTTLGEWLNPSRSDYQKFIDEEKTVGKIELYNKQGLIYPYFCAFADSSGNIGSLGDGCHRFIDCNYLIMQGKNLSRDIESCRLDVLCTSNLELVLSKNDIPPTYQKKQ